MAGGEATTEAKPPLEASLPRFADSAEPDSRRPVLLLVAGGLALLLPLLTVRITTAPAWTPRYALLGVEAAVGLPLAFSLLRTARRRAAAAALVFAGVAMVSALVSDNFSMSLFGLEYWGTGALYILALVGAWSIGCASGPRAARFVERALLVGLAANLVVATGEVFVDLSRFGVGTYNGQPTGLWGQPVELATFLIAGLWLVVRRDRNVPTTTLLWVTALVAGIELAGERLSLVLVPFVLAAALRRVGRKRILGVALACVLGLALGWMLTTLEPSTPSASDRLAGPTSHAPRVENYIGAVDAMMQRPILGWGPGRYLAATSSERTRTLALSGPNTYFTDAHDSVLQYGVTTGIVGLSALLVWFFLALRVARGPLVGFAVLVAIVQLAQPQSTGITVLAFLALGAASTVGVTEVSRVVPRPMQVVMLGAGIVFAGLVMLGGYHEREAINGSRVDGEQAARLLPHWPDRALTAARAWMASTEGAAIDRVANANSWGMQAVERDDRDVRAQVLAGSLQLIAGHNDAGAANYAEASRLDPWSPQAMDGQGIVAARRGNRDEAIAWYRRALEIDPTDTLARDLLTDALNGAPPP